MPYIKLEERDRVVYQLGKNGHLQIDTLGIRTPGQLNFAITVLIREYLDRIPVERTGYTQWNEVIGVLECCKLEIYRAQVGEYENSKRKENGPVFED